MTQISDSDLDDVDLSAESSGTALAVIDRQLSVPKFVNQDELQRWLREYGVELTDETLALLTDEQAETVWEWMELHPDESLKNGDELDNAWCEKLPEFMEFRMPEKLFRRIALKTEPEVLDAEVESAGNATTGTEIPTTAVNKTADVRLAAENARLQSGMNRIREANELVQLRTSEREAAESAVSAAKAELKEAQADLDKATAELSRVILDVKSGQQQLPFGDSSPAGDRPVVTVSVAATSEKTGPAANSKQTNKIPYPISELSQSSIKKTVGKGVFDRCKNQDDPIGLSDKQLEKLHSAEWTTIELLEKAMREVRDWWSALAKSQDAAIVTRVSSTLREFRMVNPQER